MGQLTSNLNNLSFSGAFDRSDLRRLLATLHNLRKAGYRSANLDLSGLAKAFTPEFLPLSVQCRSLMHQGFEVMLELPTDPKLKRLFENSNWAYLIDPRSHDRSQFDSSNHLPAILYSNPDEQFDAIEKVINLSLKNLQLTNRQQVASIEWSVNEIADNVLNHAHSAIGGVVQASARPTENFIEYVVCDAGLGIPKTLRDSHRNITTDLEALDRAIREGVTRNKTTNMGNGLFGSYRLAQLSGGSFHIYSGFASLTYTPKNGLHVSQEMVPFAGTLIVCSIRVSDAELLSEALTFRGERHTPYSVAERISDDEHLSISLAYESAFFGSRPAAKPVRQKIENLVRTTSAHLVIDLADVALISSSFADEVFGKLFVDLGPLEFMSRITIKGGSKIVRQLIDRAISQRSALGQSMDNNS